MTVTVNGEAREVRDGISVEEFLASLGLGSGGIAVACNDRVVRKSEYPRHRLAQGDRVEIIKAVAGG